MKWFILCLLIVVGCVVLDKWLFESVMATDWPGWVKYILLS